MAAMSGATGLTDGPVHARSTATAVPSGAELLPCKEDFYSGVIVTPELLPADVATFTQQMLLSLTAWKAMGKRGIWLKVPTARVALIAPAVEQGGFRFHHAEEGYVMLTHWIPSTACTLPPNCSHQVGVGAFVLNERNQVLVVQERNGPLKGKGVWKMPTGLLDPAEDVMDGAVREVWEETGIRCSFRSLLAVRQAHGFAFGKSDLFMLCALHADTANQELVPQASEIDAVKWMDLAEYMDNPFMKGIALYDLMRERCFAYTQGRYRGLNAAKMEAGSSRQRIDLLMWGADDASGVTGTAPAAPAAMPSVNPSSL
ncbi:MAG: hypothetical protein WDW36_009724 [Sanguina aurantia]